MRFPVAKRVFIVFFFIGSSYGSDRDALLKAINANPDEDTPRLMLADWLDEHGEPERAEFIRVSCELAKLSPGTQGYDKARKRHEELLRKHTAKFLPPNVKRALSGVGIQYEFHRGLVDRIELTPQAFLRPSVQAALSELYGIRDVSLIGGTDRPQALLRHLTTLPLKESVSSLTVRLSQEETGSFDTLFKADFKNLKALDLSSSNLSAPDIHQLALASFTPRLTKLTLQNCSLTRDAMHTLFRHASFGRLANLDVRLNDIPSFRIPKDPGLPNLRFLAIEGSSIALVVSLFESPLFEQLSELRIPEDIALAGGMTEVRNAIRKTSTTHLLFAELPGSFWISELSTAIQLNRSRKGCPEVLSAFADLLM